MSSTVLDPDVRLFDPEQLDAECETYPTPVIWEGALKEGVSDPVVVTVKAPEDGGQSYLSVPVPGVGPPLRARVPPQALDVTADCAGIVTEGIVRVVAATAAPTNRTPTKIRTIGLA